MSLLLSAVAIVEQCYCRTFWIFEIECANVETDQESIGGSYSFCSFRKSRKQWYCERNGIVLLGLWALSGPGTSGISLA